VVRVQREIVKRLLLTAVVSCGGSSQATQPPDVGVAPDATGPNLVLLNSPFPLALVSYRDGRNGGWTVPTQRPSGEYELHVTNDYQWVAVCANAPFYDAELHGATIADGELQTVSCVPPNPDPTRVTVTGQMVQPGTVCIESAATGNTNNWGFALSVRPGNHDLVAFDTTDIAIRRHLAISTGTAVPPVDLSTEGVSLVPVNVVINNLGSDVSSTLLLLTLDSDSVSIPGSATSFVTPPSSLLQSTDFEFFLVSTANGSGFRTGFTDVVSDGFTFSLMPPVSGVSFAHAGADVVATWGNLPDFASLELQVVGTAGKQRMVASKSWLTSTGTTQLLFEPYPPGYDTSWRVDLAGPYVEWLIAKQFVGNVLYWSGERFGVNGATVPSIRASAHQIMQRFAGFIGVPAAHWNALANSGTLRSAP
jgi:hypothetical protein